MNGAASRELLISTVHIVWFATRSNARPLSEAGHGACHVERSRHYFQRIRENILAFLVPQVLGLHGLPW